MKTIQISRESTMALIRGSVAYPSTSQWKIFSVISTPMCSSEWVPPSNRTSGSASSTVTLSEILAAHIWRPWYVVPIEKRWTMSGWALAVAATSAATSV